WWERAAAGAAGRWGADAAPGTRGRSLGAWVLLIGRGGPARRSAFYVVQRAHGAIEVPGDRVGDQTAGLVHDRVLGAEHIVPVPGEQEDHVLDHGLTDGDRSGPPARSEEHTSA